MSSMKWDACGLSDTGKILVNVAERSFSPDSKE